MRFLQAAGVNRAEISDVRVVHQTRNRAARSDCDGPAGQAEVGRAHSDGRAPDRRHTGGLVAHGAQRRSHRKRRLHRAKLARHRPRSGRPGAETAPRSRRRNTRRRAWKARASIGAGGHPPFPAVGFYDDATAAIRVTYRSDSQTTGQLGVRYLDEGGKGSRDAASDRSSARGAGAAQGRRRQQSRASGVAATGGPCPRSGERSVYARQPGGALCNRTVASVSPGHFGALGIGRMHRIVTRGLAALVLLVFRSSPAPLPSVPGPKRRRRQSRVLACGAVPSLRGSRHGDWSGGEVIVLDSGGYGSGDHREVVVDRLPAGIYAGISVFWTRESVSTEPESRWSCAGRPCARRTIPCPARRARGPVARAPCGRTRR